MVKLQKKKVQSALQVPFISKVIFSVAGLSMDFVVLNALGHAYYTVFNTALYYNPTIKVGFV